MIAYTYIKNGEFALTEKPKPALAQERDAVVKVTLASICTSDLHIKHGSVPRAVPGVTVGHEMVGVVEETGFRRKKRAERRPRCRQCGNFLRKLFFLQERFREQTARTKTAAGARLQDRRAAAGIREGAFCRYGIKQNTRRRKRRTGAVCGRYPRNGLLGGENCRHFAKRHRADHRRRADGNMYPAFAHG